MFFYEVQQSGKKPDWNEVSWRSDCMTNDYVTGGWFDAGDHLKFTLTNAYSAALLGWGLLNYGDGVEKAGQRTMYENNLQFALDYLVGCDQGDNIVYMIGDGSFDHVWWGSAEVYMDKYELMKGETERPYYTCEDSCIQADMAAALCTGYLNFKDSKPEKAKEYLEHAIDLFDRADKLRAIGDDPEEQSYYKITTFYDDLFYAANWLYMATGEQKYLDLCKTDYIPNLGKEEQSSEMKYTWGMCWDDVMQGGVLLYAINTGESQWKDQFTKHLEYWTTGYGGKQITYTPDGLPWLFQWGSLRHATTTAFLAYVAVDQLYQDDTAKAEKYTKFADNVMNYCFGDNSKNFSYVVGMGDDYPQAWHHRTSSGAWNDKWSNIGQTEGEDAKPHAHILYGELVGGPMYYIKNGLTKKWHWLAYLLAAFGVLTVFGTGNATQVNTITTAINSALLNYNVISESAVSTSNLIIGIIIAILIAMILLGGIKRIGHVTEKLVPFMALLYILLGLGVILLNIQNVPAVFASIIRGAFQPRAVTGGIVLSMFTSLKKGVSRGIFSNEAGLGTGSIAHACADTKKPVKQGFFGIFEVFTDTIVICTLTALVILCSGVPVAYGEAAGAELTISGFTSTYGSWVSIFTAVSMCCFAFSTIIGWGLYGARCIEFIFDEKIIKPFMVAYSLVAILGATVDLGLLWNIADTFNGLMAIPNLIGVFLLSGTVFKLTKEYFETEGKNA